MSLRTSSLVLLLLATLSFASPARAGSLSVGYWFNTNSGSGDNAAGYISGPGTLIGTGGGTGCSWCFAGTFLSPGTTLSPSIYSLDFGPSFTGMFQGAVIDPSNFNVGSTTLSGGSFTFPSFEKGGMFTITVPASMGIVNIWNGTQGQVFELQPGQLRLTFGFAGNQYYFQSGQFTSGTVVTPEPQTLALFGSGLLMIATASFRKYRQREIQPV